MLIVFLEKRAREHVKGSTILSVHRASGKPEVVNILVVIRYGHLVFERAVGLRHRAVSEKPDVPSFWVCNQHKLYFCLLKTTALGMPFGVSSQSKNAFRVGYIFLWEPVNTHTLLTQRSRSGLTMLLSRHIVGTYPVRAPDF